MGPVRRERKLSPTGLEISIVWQIAGIADRSRAPSLEAKPGAAFIAELRRTRAFLFPAAMTGSTGITGVATG